MFYTGVGSRDITQEEYQLLKQIGTRMSELGYTLRSGAADGSDQAFQHGACYDPKREIKTEIWIPWKTFQIDLQNATPFVNYHVPSLYDFNIARKFYLETGIIPWFDSMKGSGEVGGWSGPKKLHGRNYYQVKGKGDLSKVCIYCAPENSKGEVDGGTRSAVMVSRHFNVPTFNIRIPEQKEILLKRLKM